MRRMPTLLDPLLCLRDAIAAQKPPILVKLTTEPDSCKDESITTDVSIGKATHLRFIHTAEPFNVSLDVKTRFISSVGPVDLRSVYFAWLKKDAAIPEYIALSQKANEECSETGASGAEILKLVFVERLDLNSWLAKTSEESEHIKPLLDEPTSTDHPDSNKSGINAYAASIAHHISSRGARDRAKQVDPLLPIILKEERSMGNRNTVLRGVKVVDFSHIQKHADLFLSRARSRSNQYVHRPHQNLGASGTFKKHSQSSRRPDPIILLPPSASSLLRMSNIKQFLESGVYVPPDSAEAGTTSSANILHIMRAFSSIDSSRPLRFILADNTDQFKPDYWNRVIAVFTTGQPWQFRSYKWSQPSELFSHCLGLYVGWVGEKLPNTICSWGRDVKAFAIDKWIPAHSEKGRWRDREVVERIWTVIEDSLRARGWSK